MFYDTKSLIVVYKDEMLLNQVKKLVETNDDSEDGDNVIGTRDNSINIISWNESTWIDQKKTGNITNKVLFLGDIKGVDKLIPVIDEVFGEYGVHYGWAGNQAVVYADMKALKKMDDYQKFLDKLEELPVPDVVKKANRIDNQKETEENSEPFVENDADDPKEKPIDNIKKPFEFIKNIGDNIGDVVQKTGSDLSVLAKDLFKDKKMMERQMLFYGVINMYNNGLETFMNN